jgi:hypothetical protein
MSLREYFALVERGSLAVPRAELAKHVSAEAHAVLRSAGLTRAGRALTSWECDLSERRCGREIMASAPGSATPFIAVCEGSFECEDPCPSVDVTAEDIAQETLATADLMRVVRQLYRIEGEVRAPALASLSPSDAEPLLLGVERAGDSVRDVFVTLRPGDATFPLFLAARERASRGALVLVPTAARLGATLPVRHGAGAHVEIEVLEDAVAVREGKLTRVAKLRLVSPEPVANETESTSKRPPGIAAELGATSFAQLKVTVVDGHTLRISCGKKWVRRTYVDLGLHTGGTREISKQWKLLLAVCQGQGHFRWKNFGAFGTVSTAMSRLRKKLCDAFGLDEDPFEEHHVVKGWRPKFMASSEIAPEGM